MIKSMTGFANSETSLQDVGSLAIELRSVNHRYLDINCRMPDILRVLEPRIRESIKKRISRGKIDLSIRFEVVQSKKKLEYDQELAEQLAATLHEIDRVIYNAAPTCAIDILNWPGVLLSTSIEPDELEGVVVASLDEAITRLISLREAEGKALKKVLVDRCDEVLQIVETLVKEMPALLQAQRDKLKEKLAELKQEVNLERLEQEIVYLAQKSDIDEEIERLQTHINQVKQALELDEPVGRRLDFLMQELNREANTIGSKSIGITITQASVDLKVLIEQMREQVQNIE